MAECVAMLVRTLNPDKSGQYVYTIIEFRRDFLEYFIIDNRWRLTMLSITILYKNVTCLKRFISNPKIMFTV